MCASTAIKTKQNKKHNILEQSLTPKNRCTNKFYRTKKSQVSLRSLFCRAFSDCPNYDTVLPCGVLVYLVLYGHHIIIVRVRINRVRLPILLVVRERLIFPCLRSRLRIWSHETGSIVPSRVSLLISILRLNIVLTCRTPPDFRGGVRYFNRHTPSGQSRVYRITQLRTDGIPCRESAGNRVYYWVWLRPERL